MSGVKGPALLLASGSPRRREMLAALGWKFDVRPSPVEEEILPGEQPEEAARRLAVHKGAPLAAEHPHRIVLAADTLVTVDGRILGKPAHRAEALDMLILLSEEALRAYAETGEGDDKAGSYGIQGKGALLVSSISGCYFNVVGLPLARLSEMLIRMGVDMECQWRTISR